MSVKLGFDSEAEARCALRAQHLAFGLRLLRAHPRGYPSLRLRPEPIAFLPRHPSAAHSLIGSPASACAETRAGAYA